MPEFTDLPSLLTYLLDDLAVAWLVSPVLAAGGSALAALGVLLVGSVALVRARRAAGRRRGAVAIATGLWVLAIMLGASSVLRIQRAVGHDIGAVIRLMHHPVHTVALVGRGRPVPDRVLPGTRVERTEEGDLEGLMSWLEAGGFRLAVLSRRHLDSISPAPKLLVEWEAGGTVVVARGRSGPWRLPVVAETSAHHVEVLWESSRPDRGRAWVVPVAGGKRVEVHEELRRRVHRVRFDELTPDTDYAFGVMSAGASRWGRFRTLPAPDAAVPLRLAVIGDSGGREVVTPRLVEAMTAFRPHSVLHVGDLAYDRATRRSLRSQFYEPFWNLWREIPVRIAPGNHDIPAAGRDLSRFLGVPGYQERPVLELLESAGVRVVGLNSNAPPVTPFGADATVRSALSEGSPWWRIAFFHHPPWSAGEKQGMRALRMLLHPVLLGAETDLAFSGHAHNYQRSVPLGRGGTEDPAGVRYIVSGGGGGKLREVGTAVHQSVARSTFHHVQIVILEGELWLDARNLAGRSIDRLYLRKAGKQQAAQQLPWTDPPKLVAEMRPDS